MQQHTVFHDASNYLEPDDTIYLHLSNLTVMREYFD